MFILTLDSNDPFFNLSAEEYFLCEKDEDFFLLWQNEPCVVIGKNQVAADEINPDYVSARSLPVVRRMTGGGAQLRFAGLDENAQYRNTETGEIYGGDFLMNVGLYLPDDRDHESRILIFEQC